MLQPFFDTSTKAAAAAPSSTSTPNEGNRSRYPYKVFLSFRGEDTRHGFVSHLYKELTLKGIHTFKDDHDLNRGDSLTPSLLEAISGSRVAVVVLSEHYASSTWCLNELVEIMECRKRNRQLVVPIFYKVDPSDVKNQKGCFEEDLKKREKKRKRENDYEAEMKKWRNALTQVATIAGWDSSNLRDEANLIECVVRDISDKLACVTSSYACDDFVAIGSQIAEIGKLLEVERDVHMLGIWGMGGMGKTTLAKILYDKVSSQYESRCFLKNVKDKFKNIGALRHELLSKVLKERDLNTWSLDEDSSIIKERLCCKKVLIVLDDVDDIEQLEVLAKHHNWFGVGSTIIITTRDKRLLDLHEVDATYQVKCLKTDEALQLFSRHAFKQNQIKKEYWGLAVDFVNYAKGLPLTLQILGRSLRNRPIDFWKDELQNLGNTSNPSISDVLKVSFVGLEVNEKDVFLDIACFHNGNDKDEIRLILSDCGLFPHRAFPILIEKSLISIQENKVCMHELLQDMGRDIVLCESDKPGERSRLWDYKDINYVLTEKKGTEMIKGMSLHLCNVQGEMNLEEDAFMGIDRLRFLKVSDPQDKLHLPHYSLQFCTDELAYLGWKGYPLKSLSLGFWAQNLVQLDLSYSKVETLWEGAQEFVNLKVLNLEGSKYLVRTPDLSKAQNIMTINLMKCKSLIEVHSSIELLNKLEVLVMSHCISLSQLPNCLGKLISLESLYLVETAITELPSSLQFLKTQKLLSMEGCNLFQQPNSLDKLNKSLEVLYSRETDITELPASIEFMNRLVNLDVTSCKNLSQLPNWLGNFTSLKSLVLERTAITELPQSIENLTLLRRLDLSYCEKLESLPTNLRKLSSLSDLKMDYCKRVHSIPKLPPLLEKLHAAHCESLENFSDNFKGGIQGTFESYFWFDFRECYKLSEKAYGNILSFALFTIVMNSPKKVQFWLPGSEIPTWICNQAAGSSIKVQTPSNFASVHTVSSCVVFKCEHTPPFDSDFSFRYRCHFKGDSRNQGHIEDEVPIQCVEFIFSSDQALLCNFQKPEALDCVVGNELSFEFFIQYRSGATLSEIKVNKCGISFLADQGCPHQCAEPKFGSCFVVGECFCRTVYCCTVCNTVAMIQGPGSQIQYMDIAAVREVERATRAAREAAKEAKRKHKSHRKRSKDGERETSSHAHKRSRLLAVERSIENAPFSGNIAKEVDHHVGMPPSVSIEMVAPPSIWVPQSPIICRAPTELPAGSLIVGVGQGAGRVHVGEQEDAPIVYAEVGSSQQPGSRLGKSWLSHLDKNYDQLTGQLVTPELALTPEDQFRLESKYSKLCTTRCDDVALELAENLLYEGDLNIYKEVTGGATTVLKVAMTNLARGMAALSSYNKILLNQELHQSQELAEARLKKELAEHKLEESQKRLADAIAKAQKDAKKEAEVESKKKYDIAYRKAKEDMEKQLTEQAIKAEKEMKKKLQEEFDKKVVELKKEAVTEYKASHRFKNRVEFLQRPCIALGKQLARETLEEDFPDLGLKYKKQWPDVVPLTKEEEDGYNSDVALAPYQVAIYPSSESEKSDEDGDDNDLRVDEDEALD